MSRPPVEAVLQAGDTETLYRRAGDGPPVLLVCSGALAEPLGGLLFERLATRARVIAAAVPPGASAADVLADWLDDVTEGLGLMRPTLVIDEALAAGLLGGAPDAPAAPAAFDGVVVAAATGATVAVEGGDAAAIAEVVRTLVVPR